MLVIVLLNISGELKLVQTIALFLVENILFAISRFCPIFTEVKLIPSFPLLKIFPLIFILSSDCPFPEIRLIMSSLPEETPLKILFVNVK